MRFAVALVAIGLLGGCAASQTEGSIGVVLARDAESRAVFVHEIPERAPAKGEVIDLEPPLLPGDELMMVDGSYVREMSKDDLRLKLRGPPGSKVKLTIARGGQILRVEVARTPLKQGLLRPKEERMVE